MSIVTVFASGSAYHFSSKQLEPYIDRLTQSPRCVKTSDNEYRLFVASYSGKHIADLLNGYKFQLYDLNEDDIEHLYIDLKDLGLTEFLPQVEKYLPVVMTKEKAVSKLLEKSLSSEILTSYILKVMGAYTGLDLEPPTIYDNLKKELLKEENAELLERYAYENRHIETATESLNKKELDTRRTTVYSWLTGAASTVANFIMTRLSQRSTPFFTPTPTPAPEPAATPAQQAQTDEQRNTEIYESFINSLKENLQTPVDNTSGETESKTDAQ
uniref:Uncharacterized protein n=1 Tax=viral metagenome TaxID=1070528 RepID=A0A6C0EG70_9ZZZZ